MGVCVVNPVHPTSLPHDAAKRLILKIYWQYFLKGCESCRSHIAPTRRCQAPFIVGLPLPSLTRFKASRLIKVKADNIRLGYGATLIWWPMQVKEKHTAEAWI